MSSLESNVSNSSKYIYIRETQNIGIVSYLAIEKPSIHLQLGSKRNKFVIFVSSYFSSVGIYIYPLDQFFLCSKCLWK